MLLSKGIFSLLLAASPAAHAASSLRPNQKSSANTVTLPILPHDAIVERRRRELRAQGKDDSAAVFSPPTRRLDYDGPYYETEPQMAQLYQGYGTHYMDLYVGTPPQRQTVIIDTADFLTAFPCAACADCGLDAHTDPVFNESASRTFRKFDCKDCLGQCFRDNGVERCIYQMDYGADGSFVALQAKDVAYCGGPHDTTLYPPVHWDEGMSGIIPEDASAFTFRLNFGCKLIDKGLFQTQLANGVAGMAPSDMAIWKQMKWDSVVPDYGFSLCFAPLRPLASKTGTGSGAITLGGTNTQLHGTPMLYAKDVRNSTLAESKFSVHIRKVYLRRHGGQSVEADGLDEVLFELRDVDETELNRGGVIIDSFTTGTYLRSVLEGPFREQWNKVVDFEFTNDPIEMSAEEVSKLPTILLQLAPAEEQTADVSDPYVVTGLAGELGEEDTPNDIVVAISPQHYMLYNPTSKSYHSSFRFLQNDNAGAILGANFLMGHNVHFDVSPHGMRIGFSESTCEYEKVVQDEKANYPTREKDTDTDTEVEAPQEGETKSPIKGRNNWNSKCGGWCVFGKLTAIIIGIVCAVGMFRLYNQVKARKMSKEEETITMPGMNDKGEQWSPEDKKSVMPGRIVEKVPPLPAMT